MPNATSGRMIAAVLILIGAILLIGALVTPWYSYESSGNGLSETRNYYLGMPSTNGTIQPVCSGLPSCPTQTSYSTQNLNNTGSLAEAGFFMVIGGFALGIIAAILGVVSRRNPRRAAPVMALAALALVLAIAAPGLFAVSLPGAAAKDSPGHLGSGPWSSFFGSNSTTISGITITTTWGPGIGWYLSIVAFVILLVGVILLARYRREPPQPMTAPAPVVPTTSTMPPPSSPPAP
ncbi:MAG: hypothetical protein WB852_08570 [Thermoplasmata archaeon]